MPKRGTIVSNSELQDKLSAVLGDSMGVRVERFGWPARARVHPVVAAFLAFAVLIFFFSLPVWVVESRHITTVVRLSIWGALYFGAATYMARLATEEIMGVIIDEMQPLMSESQKAYVCNALESRFSTRRILWVSIGVATLAIGASSFALQAATIQGWALALILMEFFVLYLTGAQATYAATFYATFAEAVAREPQALSPLRNSESPIIVVLRSVGAIVLLFWIGIMLAVLTLIYFSATANMFVLVVVPVASFFSFVRGSAVFISVDLKLRRACRRAAANVRRRLDTQARTLIDDIDESRDSTIERLDKVSKLLDATTAKTVGASFLVAISLMTPLVGPVVSLLVHFYGKGA